MSYFRDIMVYNECRDDRYLINLDKKYIIIDECQKFTYNSLNNIISCIKKTADNIKANVNYQLSIEMMLLSMQEG
jgi:DNA polymerase-3 subunit delta'